VSLGIDSFGLEEGALISKSPLRRPPYTFIFRTQPGKLGSRVKTITYVSDMIHQRILKFREPLFQELGFFAPGHIYTHTLIYMKND
jgi:hypothetical protein